VLRSLGFGRSQLVGVSLLRATVVALAAAVVGAVVAVAASPLFPIGPARTAEPHPGLSVDATVVILGALGIAVAVLLLSAASAWWYARGAHSTVEATHRPSRVSAWLWSAGSPVVPSTGVRMALEPGRGRTSVPMRSTIISAILGVAVIAGVLGFSSSLARLLDDPHLYGWNWDIQVGDQFAPNLRPEAERVAARSEAEGVAVGTIARLYRGHTFFDTLAIEAVKGTVDPTVVEGRAPVTPTEIMLGTRTLDDLGRAATIGRSHLLEAEVIAARFVDQGSVPPGRECEAPRWAAM